MTEVPKFPPEVRAKLAAGLRVHADAMALVEQVHKMGLQKRAFFPHLMMRIGGENEVLARQILSIFEIEIQNMADEASFWEDHELIKLEEPREGE